MFKEKSSNFIARAGITASLYAVLSLITFPIASSNIQFRISEGLCLLPLIMPETILGLTVGCVISNLLTGCAIYDIIFGSLITLISSVLTFIIGKTVKSFKLKIFSGGLFPVILNALLLPVIWIFFNGSIEYVYLLQVLFIFLSESLSVYGVGIFVILGLKKRLNL